MQTQQLKQPAKRAFAHQARIPVDLWQSLLEVAAEENRSVNNLIVSILREAISSEEDAK